MSTIRSRTFSTRTRRQAVNINEVVQVDEETRTIFEKGGVRVIDQYDGSIAVRYPWDSAFSSVDRTIIEIPAELRDNFLDCILELISNA